MASERIVFVADEFPPSCISPPIACTARDVVVRGAGWRCTV
jgi:hypothetical protein